MKKLNIGDKVRVKESGKVVTICYIDKVQVKVQLEPFSQQFFWYWLNQIEEL